MTALPDSLYRGGCKPAHGEEIMEANPLDELGSQLPGRLIAVEVLLVLLLRKKPDAVKMLREADGIVTLLESEVTRDGLGREGDYALKIFNAARESLENIGGQVLRRR